MKKQQLIIVFLMALLLMAGCSGAAETEPAVIPPSTTEMQSSSAGMAPDLITEPDEKSGAKMPSEPDEKFGAEMPSEPDEKSGAGLPSESGAVSGASTAPEPIAGNTQPVNAFSLEVTLNDSEHKLAVTQKLTYYNNTGTELTEIYFNLIPVAFETDGGGIQMGNILIAGQTCQMTQVQGTVYKLGLPSTLKADEKLEIQMDYDVSIPNIQNRFGYQESVYNLGNFIITPAVYTGNGWAQQPYVDLGDAFFTDIADYDVKINVPEGYTVAATGRETEPGSGLYHAEDVRDFVFCASASYETISAEYGGVSITVYYNDDMSKTAARVMDTAKKSLDLCSEKFGEYPYDTLSLVMNGLTGGVNGMEYPTLVMISPDPPLEHLDGVDLSNPAEVAPYTISLDNSVCHEIAHQWFYGIVGNNQISDPWIDEGFCRYAEYLFQMAYPPEAVHESTYMTKDRLEDRYMALSGEKEKAGIDYAPDTTDLGRSLNDWVKDDPMGYSDIYDKGASLIYQMEKQMGGEAFDAALKAYVRQFAYSIVSTEDFKSFWIEREDFSNLFDLYF